MSSGEMRGTPAFTGPLSDAPTGLLVSSAPGDRLGGRYTLLGLLGVGGMGSVYRARDEELDEIVALKVLRQDLIGEPGMAERFRREVKLARRVTHKNVARVFDIGDHGSDKYLTMEYVEGEPLSTLIARQGALPVARVIEIATAVCAGLGAAHAAGVVHRDLKPENVLVEKGGRVVITDFGIARACIEDAARTLAGTAVGTPAYMSPEQVQGLSDIDARADIYALGAMLYELFTGDKAWKGDSIVTVAAARLVQPPPDPRSKRPELPTACATVVLKCMARDRNDRYATAQAVAEELSNLTVPAANRKVMGTLVVPASPEQPGPTAATSPGEKTVAVLPFRNSGAAEDDYIAEGLTDDLIDMLSMTRGLKVRPRGVVMRFKGVDSDPREIGRDLGVQVVVEGNVRKTPVGVRINSRLVSVADGFQLWAKRFDRPEKDLLVVNDEVAKAIADALTVDLSSPAREAPTDPVAIELYLRARAEYRKFWHVFVEKSVTLFEQALERAPDDPTILAGYAMARARMAFGSGDNAPLAKKAAERAVTVAPHLGETHLAMAHALFQLGDVSGAVRSLKAAIARAPALAEAHMQLGMILAEVGLLDEAARWLETAQGLDPSAHVTARTLARVSFMRGDWERTLSLMDEARRVEGEFAYRANIGRFLMWRRDQEHARQIFASFPAEENERISAIQRIVWEALINKTSPFDLPDYQDILGPTSAGGWRRGAYFHQLATEMAAYLDDDERFQKGLAGAVAAGLIDLAWIDMCPLLDKYRSTPEVQRARIIVEERASRVIEAYRAG
ncbi:protein kinase domain-containing protein [Polyangium aurulentum]|uniref:protein kinase domain-containing protein n=1 Tax=Polyangium aurulentum TaxID=2567896 RepID=UPI0010AE4BAC|nr:protein kinase [Polyangium aurulentum]UQA59637.1 protein kinase [Polyangium aurulentum]